MNWTSIRATSRTENVFSQVFLRSQGREFMGLSLNQQSCKIENYRYETPENNPLY